EISETVPDDYLDQLLSESIKRTTTGVRWVKNPGSTRNEALDCLVYSYAASRYVLSKMSWDKLIAMKDSLNSVKEEPVKAPESQSNEQIEETKPITRPQRQNIARRPNRGRSWVTSF
ncbi:terminase, partial [Escherichia coli]|nr:terminase [Escherichia coli]